MVNSVRFVFGLLYSCLTSSIFLAVLWAALTMAVPTAATNRFSSSPRFLNEMSWSAATAASVPHRDRPASKAAPARRVPIRVIGSVPLILTSWLYSRQEVILPPGLKDFAEEGYFGLYATRGPACSVTRPGSRVHLHTPRI